MKKLLFATAALLALPVAAAASPYEPVYGSPNSVQFQTFQRGADAQSIDVEGPERFSPDGDADTIGGAVTFFDGFGIDGERYELRYQKAGRPFEGDRTRALFDAHVNVLSSGGENATQAVISGGLEFPITDNWSLTPRATYAAVFAPAFFGGDGELVAGSLTSRYRVPQIGRGDLVIVNSIFYTDTVSGFLTDNPFAQSNHNWTYRNGLAYQFPLQSMMFGRQSSMRFSYVFTKIDGDPVFMDRYNEVSANLGVRAREATTKSGFELLRFGLLYTWGDIKNVPGSYHSTTLTAGYRF